MKKKSCFYFISCLEAPYIKSIKYKFSFFFISLLITIKTRLVLSSSNFEVLILYPMLETKKCSTFHSLVTHLSLQSFKQKFFEISVLCGWLAQELLRQNMSVIVLIFMSHQRSASSSNHPHLL